MQLVDWFAGFSGITKVVFIICFILLRYYPSNKVFINVGNWAETMFLLSTSILIVYICAVNPQAESYLSRFDVRFILVMYGILNIITELRGEMHLL